MKPGPPPQPLNLRILRGNPGKRALRPEPQPLIAEACPEPPPHVTGYAADEWWTTGPELHRLGLLSRLDVPQLAAYCYAYGQWRKAAEALAKMEANDPVTNGQLIKSKYGDVAQNPLISVARKQAADLMRFASEFGLSPRARTLLQCPNAPPPGGGKFTGLIAR